MTDRTRVSTTPPSALLLARVMLAQILVSLALVNSFFRLPADVLAIGAASDMPSISAAVINAVLVWGAVVLVLGVRTRFLAVLLGLYATVLLQLTASVADARLWHDFSSLVIVVLAAGLLSRGGGRYTGAWALGRLRAQWRI